MLRLGLLVTFASLALGVATASAMDAKLQAQDAFTTCYVKSLQENAIANALPQCQAEFDRAEKLNGKVTMLAVSRTLEIAAVRQ